jgi:hypothetical protein
MTQTLAKPRNTQPLTIEQALVVGDLSGLDPEQRINYYLKVCSSLGLNPYTKPFDYLTLNGRLVLYARKDATDQLRKLHKVSITRLEREQLGELMVVTATAAASDGRTDSAIGAVPIQGLKGEQLANALMRAETKAKRRVTLSLCGLGMTDESEVDSIPGAMLVETSGPSSARLTSEPSGAAELDQPSPPAPADAIVRSTDERIWQRYQDLVAQAQSLGLNPVVVRLPVDRDELKIRGAELVDMLNERQEQLDNDSAEVARQKASGEL